jgi:hypothetical protein
MLVTCQKAVRKHTDSRRTTGSMLQNQATRQHNQLLNRSHHQSPAPCALPPWAVYTTWSGLSAVEISNSASHTRLSPRKKPQRRLSVSEEQHCGRSTRQLQRSLSPGRLLRRTVVVLTADGTDFACHIGIARIENCKEDGRLVKIAPHADFNAAFHPAGCYTASSSLQSVPTMLAKQI